MSDVKLLNLDDLAVIKRVVQIKGKEYEVAEQSVGQMAARLKLSKKLDTNEPEDFIEMLRQTARHILPTAPEKVLDGLTTEQIHKLVQFINDSDLENAASRLAEEAEKVEAENPEEPEKK